MTDQEPILREQQPPPVSVCPGGDKARLEYDAAEVTETAIVKHKIEPFKTIQRKAGLKKLWVAMEEDVRRILSCCITPERLLKSALAATIRNKELFQCTQQSWMMALIQSAQLGLDCSGLLGASYLVPFNNKNRLEIVYIIGYRGLIDLARRGGQIAEISAHPVYVQDEFDPQFGTDEKIVHVPYLKADRKEEYTYFYAIGKLKDGTHQSEIMTLADIKKIQTMSKSNRSPDSPWKHHFAEMGRKTVVKRLAKYLSQSTEFQKGVFYDNQVDPVPT